MWHKYCNYSVSKFPQHIVVSNRTILQNLGVVMGTGGSRFATDAEKEVLNGLNGIWKSLKVFFFSSCDFFPACLQTLLSTSNSLFNLTLTKGSFSLKLPSKTCRAWNIKKIHRRRDDTTAHTVVSSLLLFGLNFQHSSKNEVGHHQSFPDWMQKDRVLFEENWRTVT